jgi:hypothetical protein
MFTREVGSGEERRRREDVSDGRSKDGHSGRTEEYRKILKRVQLGPNGFLAALRSTAGFVKGFNGLKIKRQTSDGARVCRRGKCGFFRV